MTFHCMYGSYFQHLIFWKGFYLVSENDFNGSQQEEIKKGGGGNSLERGGTGRPFFEGEKSSGNIKNDV